ncbi:MarR family winged helix-turn-helix transcriptional regulator [Desulfosporosinus hippei]|uniref:DNA-binding transcriptional regulator, MarR family n=1 Tax=Desulfosporosinus hippei DSM 8344 TaxID=1121419 RepID=A0A1G8EFY7_9FIRM|nr:MarR family transcriptional regulator [Desulfosporosinus hippei]SDH68823.1 DNA-binding transcriptional regulator, MarR family [Desulfosporosinus hippei DSM 8344]
MENQNKSARVASLFQEVMMLYRSSMSKVFEDVGITPPQGMVLGILSKEKKLKINELSNKMNLSNSTVSGIVDRLEKQGMVERSRSESDRRVVFVSITPNFKEMHESFHVKFEKKIEKILSEGSPKDLEKVYEGLSTLRNLLREYDKD